MFWPRGLRRVLLSPHGICQTKSSMQWQPPSSASQVSERTMGNGSPKRKAPAEKERIVAEANNELTKAVTNQGLSVDEYTSILEAARETREVRNKPFQHVRPWKK